MNDGTPNMIQVKKLVAVIEEFLRNHYLKSFGYKKKIIDASVAEAAAGATQAQGNEDYEYYDEEVPGGNQTNNNS